MIHAVRSNMPSFKEVEFQPGFNVVLADRTKESNERDSRNGLGKTTLIEIIHFCLGAQPRRNRGVMVSPLKGWTFTLEMTVNGRELLNQSQGGNYILQRWQRHGRCKHQCVGSGL